MGAPAPRVSTWVTISHGLNSLLRREEDTGEEITCVRDRNLPAGLRWTWYRGEATGTARTRGDAFWAAFRHGQVMPEPPKKKSRSGPSGKNVTPRRFVGMSEEEWTLVDQASEGEPWTKWARPAIVAEASRRIAARPPKKK